MESRRLKTALTFINESHALRSTNFGWVAQAKRNPLKIRKDTVQGGALLDTTVEAMPHYVLDAGFKAQIPA